MSESHCDVFMSHNWGKNCENHNKVKQINEELKKRDIKTWFDEDFGCMQGFVMEAMADGIERSKMGLVFVTRDYHDKVNGKGPNGQNDNCAMEFRYLVRRLTVDKLVPVVMEKEMRNMKDWKGSMGMSLCDKLYVDMCGDYNDNVAMSMMMSNLTKAITHIIKPPSPSGEITFTENIAPFEIKSCEIQEAAKPTVVKPATPSSEILEAVKPTLAKPPTSESEIPATVKPSKLVPASEYLPNGKWLEVFSQTNASGIFKSQCRLGSCKVGSGTDFIDFDQIGNLSQYYFRLVWDEGKPSDSDIKDYAIEWIQEKNPLSEISKDMNPIDARLIPSRSKPYAFQGLSVSAHASTFLSGCSVPGWWWYSVGNETNHRSSKGIYGNPGVLYNDNTGLVACRTQLFVKVPHDFPAPVGKWVEVYSQSKASGMFKSKCSLGNCKVKSGTDFIDFDQIGYLPEYHFRLVWNEGKPSNDSKLKDYAVEWSQEKNPLSETSKDMNPVNATLLPTGSKPHAFQGLSISTHPNTFLSGCSIPGWWWYSVGNEVDHNSGNPGVLYSDNTGLVAHRTQLFVRVPLSFAIPEGKWLEIYSQTKASGMFKSKCSLGSCKIGSGMDFMDFNQIGYLPEYNFKLVWNEGKLSNDTKIKDYAVEWIQEKNPLSETSKDMTPVNATLIPTRSKPHAFQGLSISTHPNTFLSGCSVEGWWWYSVGNEVDHNSGNPGFLYSDNTGLVAHRTQLFVRVSPSFPVPEGKWLEVYSQTRASGMFRSECSLGNCKVGSGRNFIDFNQIACLPEYHFRLVWDDGTPSDAKIKDYAVEWVQQKNPLSETSKDMKPVHATLIPSGSKPHAFQGLSVSTHPNTFLSGCSIPGWWWYSVGNEVDHISGNPGVLYSDNTGLVAHRTQLFVKVPPNFPIPEGKWLEIYSQTKASEMFKSKCSLKSCKVGSGTDFMDFNQIGYLSEYNFKLVWNEGKLSNDAKIKDYAVEWIQEKNPLRETSTDMTPVNATLIPTGSKPHAFQGLSISTHPNTFLSGCNIPGWWWYSVGNVVDHISGNPGFLYNDNTGLVADRTQLFLKVPPNFPIPERWVEVYSQSRASGIFKSNCTLANCKVGSGKDYIDFNQIRDLHQYRFKLVWNDGKPSNDSNLKDYAVEWTQEKNPLSEKSKDMNPDNAILIPSGSKPHAFQGLSISTHPNTFLSGCSIPGWWWYSVGNEVDHNSGNPGVLYSDNTGLVAHRTQLFVRVPPSS